MEDPSFNEAKEDSSNIRNFLPDDHSQFYENYTERQRKYSMEEKKAMAFTEEQLRIAIDESLQAQKEYIESFANEIFKPPQKPANSYAPVLASIKEEPT